MTVFADSLGDLRYERGIVSFRLYAGRSGPPGVEVYLPFDDFSEIAKLLSNELPKIQQAHLAYLAEYETQKKVDPETPVSADENENEPTLGIKIASIS